MGWRFRRSIKIAPGVRWNIGKRGTSLSFGPRGLKVTAGSSGIRQTVGLPGTGLSYTRTLSTSSRPSAPSAQSAPTTMNTTSVAPDRFGIPRRSRKTVTGWLALISAVIAFVLMQAESEDLRALGGLAWIVTVASALLALAAPSRQKRAQAELARRMTQFRQELQAAGTRGDRQELESLLKRPGELGLMDTEVASEIELIQATLDLFDLEQQVEQTKQFPLIPGHEKIVGPDVCHFSAPAFVDKRGPDETGQLFLTNDRVVFLGSTLTAFSWRKVAVVRREGLDLVIQRNDRQTPLRFRMNSLSEALRGHYLAANLAGQPPVASP